MSDVAFTHDQEGTPEAYWSRLPEWSSTPELEILDARGRRPGRLVVVVAHPDDETLAMSGLLIRTATSRLPTVVVMATAGEHSHPDSPTRTPDDLRAARRVELRLALTRLHSEADVRWLGLPDGRVADHLDALDDVLAGIVDDTTLLVSTWSGDGHSDHEAVADSAARSAARVGARHLQAPIWLWHWGTRDDVPWATVRRLPLDAEAVRRRRAALEAYVSQHRPLSSAPGDEAVLTPGVLAHFDRDVETYLESSDPRCSQDSGVFERLHRDSADPWSLATSWYERRKRAVTLAALPQERLGRVLEVGCSVGVLTEALADRATHVTALDVSDAALQQARQRLGAREDVCLRRMRVPDAWPEGTYDLVVLSEVGYFLTRDECAAVLRAALGCLGPTGSLLLVHWRHPVEGWPLDGDDVHALARELAEGSGHVVTTAVLDEDFRLDLWRRRGLPSLAALEDKL